MLNTNFYLLGFYLAFVHHTLSAAPRVIDHTTKNSQQVWFLAGTKSKDSEVTEVTWQYTGESPPEYFLFIFLKQY